MPTDPTPARPDVPVVTRSATAPPRSPGVPLRCAARPRQGGLVVPWISYDHGGHALFGSVHPIRRHQALLGGLCQICGQALEERVCLVVRPMDVRVGYAPEPGLHPECLALAKGQCPMLNDSATTYRRTEWSGHPVGRPCQDPACDCPQVAAGEDQELRAGRPADQFDAWMIAAEHYRLKADPDRPGEFLGIDLDVPVLRVRPIRQGAQPRLTPSDLEWLRTAVRTLGLM
ncbi:cell envelope biogenesis protein OmpA [Kitasatospora sp. NPDC004240]